MFSGALAGDRELLDLRDGIGRAAGRLAAGLADVVRADCTRLRLLGPSGEVPVAAEREVAARQSVPDDATAARDALRNRKPVRQVTTDDRGVIVVAIGAATTFWHCWKPSRRAAIVTGRRMSRWPRATHAARWRRSPRWASGTH